MIYTLKRSSHAKAEIWDEVDNAKELKIPNDQIANRTEVKQKAIKYIRQMYVDLKLTHEENDYAGEVMRIAAFYGLKVAQNIVKKGVDTDPRKLWLEAYAFLVKKDGVKRDLLQRQVPLEFKR